MKQNRHSLLAFPHFNNVMFILPSRQSTCWSYFAIGRTRFAELVKWQGWGTWISAWPLHMT